MTTLTEFYRNLLELQYIEKPKARATIEIIAGRYEAIYDELLKIDIDLDTATGWQLDLIGSWVVIGRTLPIEALNEYFGFDDMLGAGGFDELGLDPILPVYPWYDLFQNNFTSTTLNDDRYRTMIRYKIAYNNCSAYLNNSAQTTSFDDISRNVFDNKILFEDNYDMTMTIMVDRSVDLELFTAALQLNLIPKPQGVGFKYFISYDLGNTFGFDDQPGALGFGDVFDDSVGGVFADIIVTFDDFISQKQRSFNNSFNNSFG